MKFSFDADTGIIELKFAVVHVYLEIEEEYVIPVKITNFSFGVAISTTLDNIII